MYIRKTGSNVIHYGFGLDLHKPTACQQSGWAASWVEESEFLVNRAFKKGSNIGKTRNGILKLCKKCFPSGKL